MHGKLWYKRSAHTLAHLKQRRFCKLLCSDWLPIGVLDACQNLVHNHAMSADLADTARRLFLFVCEGVNALGKELTDTEESISQAMHTETLPLDKPSWQGDSKIMLHHPKPSGDIHRYRASLEQAP